MKKRLTMAILPLLALALCGCGNSDADASLVSEIMSLTSVPDDDPAILAIYALYVEGQFVNYELYNYDFDRESFSEIKNIYCNKIDAATSAQVDFFYKGEKLSVMPEYESYGNNIAYNYVHKINEVVIGGSFMIYLVDRYSGYEVFAEPISSSSYLDDNGEYVFLGTEYSLINMETGHFLAPLNALESTDYEGRTQYAGFGVTCHMGTAFAVFHRDGITGTPFIVDIEGWSLGGTSDDDTTYQSYLYPQTSYNRWMVAYDFVGDFYLKLSPTLGDVMYIAASGTY